MWSSGPFLIHNSVWQVQQSVILFLTGDHKRTYVCFWRIKLDFVVLVHCCCFFSIIKYDRKKWPVHTVAGEWFITSKIVRLHTMFASLVNVTCFGASHNLFIKGHCNPGPFKMDNCMQMHTPLATTLILRQSTDGNHLPISLNCKSNNHELMFICLQNTFRFKLNLLPSKVRL